MYYQATKDVEEPDMFIAKWKKQRLEMAHTLQFQKYAKLWIQFKKSACQRVGHEEEEMK